MVGIIAVIVKISAAVLSVFTMGYIGRYAGIFIATHIDSAIFLIIVGVIFIIVVWFIYDEFTEWLFDYYPAIQEACVGLGLLALLICGVYGALSSRHII